MRKIIKKIYKNLPFKKQIFLLLRAVSTPSKSVYQHLHFKGNIKVKVNDGSYFKMRHYGYQVENNIFWSGLFGNWERNSLMLWTELCQNSNNIFDIGANTGVYGLIAKSVSPKSKVYAFEPVNRVFDKLSYNNKLNNFDIICVNSAVSNYNGKGVIYDQNKEHTYSVTVNSNRHNSDIETVKTEIKLVRLDSFIEENNIDNIDLMKIDVETHEVEALEGFVDHIQKFEPTIIIEILNDDVASGVESIISGIGYEYYNINDIGGVRRVDHLEKSDDHNFLICKPNVAKGLKTLNRMLDL